MGKKGCLYFPKKLENYVRRIKLLKLSIVRCAIAALISQLIDSSMYCSGFSKFVDSRRHVPATCCVRIGHF